MESTVLEAVRAWVAYCSVFVLLFAGALAAFASVGRVCAATDLFVADDAVGAAAAVVRWLSVGPFSVVAESVFAPFSGVRRLAAGASYLVLVDAFVPARDLRGRCQTAAWKADGLRMIARCSRED